MQLNEFCVDTTLSKGSIYSKYSKWKKSHPELDVDIPSWKIIAKFNIFQVDRLKIYSTFQSLTSKVL